MELTGRTLGKYQVVEKLGWGGMAVIYKGHDPALQRFVAIKVMLPQLVWAGPAPMACWTAPGTCGNGRGAN